MDSFMRSEGWTHRRKRRSKHPYLIFQWEAKASLPGGVFVDQESQYRYVAWTGVIELEEN